MSHDQAAPDLRNADDKAPGGGRRRAGRDRHRDGKGAKSQRDPSKMIDVAREKIEAKRWKEAVSMLKRAQSADRNNGVVVALLALCYLYQRKLVDCRKLMKRALEMAPLEPEVHLIHGKVLHNFGEMDASANAYTYALHLKPDYGDAFRELAVLLIDAGVLDQATEALITAVKLNPKDAVAYYHLGLIKKKQNLDEAEAMLERAVKLRPRDGYIVDSLGWVYYRLGRYEEAVTQLERAVELRPQDPTINDHLGDAFWQVGRKHEARFQWHRALSLEPEEDQVPVIEKKIKEGLVAPPEDI